MQYYIWKGFHKSPYKIGMKKIQFSKSFKYTHRHAAAQYSVPLTWEVHSEQEPKGNIGLYSKKAHPFSMQVSIQQFFK